MRAKGQTGSHAPTDLLPSHLTYTYPLLPPPTHPSILPDTHRETRTRTHPPQRHPRLLQQPPQLAPLLAAAAAVAQAALHDPAHEGVELLGGAVRERMSKRVCWRGKDGGVGDGGEQSTHIHTCTHVHAITGNGAKQRRPLTAALSRWPAAGPGGRRAPACRSSSAHPPRCCRCVCVCQFTTSASGKAQQQSWKNERTNERTSSLFLAIIQTSAHAYRLRYSSNISSSCFNARSLCSPPAPSIKASDSAALVDPRGK